MICNISLQRIQYVGWQEGTPPPTTNQTPKTKHFLLKYGQQSLLYASGSDPYIHTTQQWHNRKAQWSGVHVWAPLHCALVLCHCCVV
jgi:hypothetical protein